jgi:hypothetical protein
MSARRSAGADVTVAEALARVGVLEARVPTRCGRHGYPPSGITKVRSSFRPAHEARMRPAAVIRTILPSEPPVA